jgi:hypothetical protein
VGLDEQHHGRASIHTRIATLCSFVTVVNIHRPSSCMISFPAEAEAEAGPGQMKHGFDDRN